MARVAIVESVALLGSLLAAGLTDDDLDVIGVVTDVQEALGLVDVSDLFIVRSDLPSGGTRMLIEKSLQRNPDLRLLVVGVADNPALILDLIEAGAHGYVLENDSVDDLADNVRAALEGRALVSTHVASMLMDRVSELSQMARARGFDLDRVLELTHREREVLELVAERLTNKEIAERLFIEVGTVKNHVHSILSKLNLTGRRQAASYLEALLARKPTGEEEADG